MSLFKPRLHSPLSVNVHKRYFLLRAVTLPLLLTTGASLAQGFPGNPVKIVVPGPAGGAVDVVARTIAQQLSKTWETSVIVANRPGASTTIGTAEVASAIPDGNTLLFIFTPFVTAPHLYKSLPYDPVQSFTPVRQVLDARVWLVVSADIPAKNVKELAALIRAAPGKYSYASAGTGSTPHIFGLQLAKRAGADMLHVPYKGVAPGVLDVVAGRVSAIFSGYADVLPHLASGKLRVLAVSGTQRAKITPEVPTLREEGLPGFEDVGFGGFFVPSATPGAVVAQIAQAIDHAMSVQEVHTLLVSLAYEPVQHSTPEAFSRLVRTQFDTWGRLISAANISLN